MVALINSRFSKTISLLISVWILYAGQPVCTQAAIVYEVIDLGTLGGDRSVANFINSADQIVGWASTNQGFWHATTFDATGDGNSIDLGALSGDWSTAHSINSTGQVVGWAHDNQAHQRATIFDSMGTDNNIDLGTLGGDESRALSINDAGQIVGEAINNHGSWRATLFDPTGSGNNIDLGTLGSYESWANSINSTGRIVGAEAHNSEQWADYHAALFDSTPGGNNIDLGTLGGDWSMAYAINDANQIVGAAQNSLGFWRATLFDPAGTANNIDLGTLVGDESWAYSINNAGQIVGGASERAILFDIAGSGKNIDLNTLIDPNYGWILMQALCISDTGCIVGEGWNPEGELHAFLLVPIETKYSGGTGEPHDPYQIATASDLMLLGESPDDYDKHFILTADISLNPNLHGCKVFVKAVIAPDTDLMKEFYQGTPFAGVFNGNSYAISHLTINGRGYLGLFGELGDGAMISNLGLEAVDVNGTGDYVSGLVGSNYGSIATSYSTGTVSGTGNYVGGLVANNGGSITTSYSTCTVSGWSSVGGIVGYSFGNITASYSTGTVSGNEHVGGLIGSNGGSIATSYSTGTVSGNKNVGGLVGSNSYASIAMSFWDMETSGQTTSAGGMGLTKADMQDINTFLNAGWDFVDENLNGTCDYWQISPGDYPRFSYHIGNSPVMPEGLGTAEEPYLIRNPRDLGTVWFKPSAHYRLKASVDLSGITWSTAVIPWFGETFDGNCYVISNLRVQGGGHLGLFGELVSGAKIFNLGLEGVDVNGIGYCIGGLVGDNRGSITTSYSTGTVIGKNWVGGLVGASFSYVTDCYSKGLVSGDDSVGGLMGRNRSGLERHATVTRCYTSGTVSGTSNVGGLVGFNYDSSITASFWDTQTSGQTTSAGGAGQTTVEMQTAMTFLETGWDFVDETENGTEDTWWILEGQDYPHLWWEEIEQ